MLEAYSLVDKKRKKEFDLRNLYVMVTYLYRLSDKYYENVLTSLCCGKRHGHASSFWVFFRRLQQFVTGLLLNCCIQQSIHLFSKPIGIAICIFKV